MAMNRTRRPIKNRPLAALLFHLSGKVCLCTPPGRLTDRSSDAERDSCDDSMRGRSDGSCLACPPGARASKLESPNGCFSWGSASSSPSSRPTSGGSSPYSPPTGRALPCFPDGALSRPKVEGSDHDSDSDIEIPLDRDYGRRDGLHGEDEVTQYFKLLQQHGVAGPAGLDVRISFKWRPVLPSILEVENSSSAGYQLDDSRDPERPRLRTVNRSLKLEGYEGFYATDLQSPKVSRKVR